METKAQVRRRAANARISLDAKLREKYSKLIASKIVSNDFFRECDILLCYIADIERGEADMTHLIETAWSAKKTVAAPKVTDYKNAEMDFFAICSFDELIPGSMGILEPSGKVPLKTDTRQKTLVILPGLAFDREGNRIGYGKGFYDRYLQKHRDCHTIGAAFSVQCFDKIPADIHDRKVEAVVTERGYLSP